MLSTRFSVLPALRAAALLALVAMVSACATGPTGGRRTTASPSTPASRSRWRCWCPTAPATRGASRSPAAWRTRPGWRRPTCATPPSTSSVYPTAGTTAGGSAAASQAVAEGAKIIVGPLFSTETAGAQPVAASAGLNVLSFSNNASVAGQNVYILGTSFENTADRLVAYGLAHGTPQLRRGLPRRPRGRDRPRRGGRGGQRPRRHARPPRSPTTSRSRASRPPPARSPRR